MNNLRKIIRETIERLYEEISPKEGLGVSAIQTIVDGRRNVAFIHTPTEEELELIGRNSLGSIKVPKNPHDAWIIYSPHAEKEARELLGIAVKYNGFLSDKATDEDSRRIGQLLGYKESDIDSYIAKRHQMAEDIKLDINVGDEILGGKFKNKKIIVKDIGENEKGDITINGKPLLRFRIQKKKATK